MECYIKKNQWFITGVGDIYKDLSLLLPGIAGSRNFQPLYERASKAIREIDDKTIIFWEPGNQPTKIISYIT